MTPRTRNHINKKRSVRHTPGHPMLRPTPVPRRQIPIRTKKGLDLDSVFEQIHKADFATFCSHKLAILDKTKVNLLRT